MTTELLDIDCGGFNLSALSLKDGAHGGEFCGEACMVEMANRAAACIPALREKYGAHDFTDNHPSISPVIRSFCVAFNDGLRSDEERDRLLKPFVTRILGTKTNKKDENIRAWMATDWLVRVQTAAWLDLAGKPEIAAKLRNLKPLTNAKIAQQSQSVINDARDTADAAWDAARAAARAAARDAAWDAARAAARAAARDAAWAAAWDAAGDAAWAAARDAAKKRLDPTVTELQVSALDLLERMIAVGAKEVA